MIVPRSWTHGTPTADGSVTPPSVDYESLAACYSQRGIAPELERFSREADWKDHRGTSMGRDTVERLKEDRRYRVRMRAYLLDLVQH